MTAKPRALGRGLSAIFESDDARAKTLATLPWNSS